MSLYGDASWYPGSDGDDWTPEDDGRRGDECSDGFYAVPGELSDRAIEILSRRARQRLVTSGEH